MKICFVCLHAQPLFDPSVHGLFGGSEVRTWHFTRGLAARPEYDVSVVVFDHGQPRRQRRDGVTIVAHPGYKANPTRRTQLAAAVRRRCSGAVECAGVEFPRSRWGIYRRIDADVYCSLGAHEVSAELAVFCREYDKRFVLFFGGNMDLLPEVADASDQTNCYGASGRVCRIGIDLADAHVFQTEDQRRLFSERFGRDGHLIRNPIELPTMTPPPENGTPEQRFALWVGKSDTIKRPELCLALARDCPEISFKMVMNRSVDSIRQRILAERPENVEIVEQLPFYEMNTWFRQAGALVNTSHIEGFPNTFLQAGAHGVPLVSLEVDPEGFIERYGCGIVASGSQERLAAGVRRLWSDPQLFAACARHVRQYVEKRHALAGRIDELDALLRQVACQEKRLVSP